MERCSCESRTAKPDTLERVKCGRSVWLDVREIFFFFLMMQPKRQSENRWCKCIRCWASGNAFRMCVLWVMCARNMRERIQRIRPNSLGRRKKKKCIFSIIMWRMCCASARIQETTEMHTQERRKFSQILKRIIILKSKYRIHEITSYSTRMIKGFPFRFHCVPLSRIPPCSPFLHVILLRTHAHTHAFSINARGTRSTKF